MSANGRPTTSYYGGPEYHTPAGDNRTFFGKVLPARVPFFLNLLYLIRRGGLQAARGLFSEQVFVRRSEDVVRYVEGCGGRLHVEGLSNVRADASAAVLVANHMSLLETFMLPAMVLPSKPAVFVVKQSLMDFPYLKWILRGGRAIAVGRSNPRADLRTVLTEGAAYLREGTSVCVFPQSTRSVVFDPSQFNSIGVKLAERAGVPVLPVAVKTDFLGHGRWLKDFGPVDPSKELRFCFGEPIQVNRQAAKSAHAQVVDFIRSHLSGWGVPCKDL